MTETKNSYHRADPAFTYLLSLFFLMTGVAWGSAYADGVGPTIRIALVFVLGHFLGTSLLVSTLMYFLVGRVLGKRRQGLFGPSTSGEEGLEFGYCFDVKLTHLPGSFAGSLANPITRYLSVPFCHFGSFYTFYNSCSCR
jgi:hypothetical protein